jgi:NitT/TauT family transport system ATP-binding protein
MVGAPILSFKDVNVQFSAEGALTHALSEFNLDIYANEFICLVGQSGCGKSTALNLAAGLLTPTSGEVYMDGQIINGPDSTRAVVFQNDAVFPWMRVEQNIGFGPKSQGKSNAEVSDLVNQYLQLTGLQEFRHAWPMTLSGGMRKRVDLARAYAADPKILLMDEPFGALDFLLKENLQEQLRKLRGIDKRTIFFITHDLEEALFLGDRVVVMTPRPGTIAKIVECDFGEERTSALRTSSSFVSLRRELREFIGKIGESK